MKSLGPEALEIVRAEASQSNAALRPKLEALRQRAAQVARRRPLAHQLGELRGLRAELDSLERSIGAAERRVNADTRLCVELRDELTKLCEGLSWMLDRFDEASFPLPAQESPVGACRAVWEDAPGGEPRQGTLYLTDMRLRFERREERVLRRTLWVFPAEKEQVVGLLLDEPVGFCTAQKASRRGLLLKDELLELSWAGKGCRAPATQRLKLREIDSAFFAERLGDVIAGKVASTRVDAMPPSPLVRAPRPTCAARWFTFSFHQTE